MKVQLNQQLQLPAFSKRSLFMAVLMVILCNVLFLSLAIITKTARPIINLDYLIPLLLFVIPYKIARIFGVCCLIIAIIFDVLMFVMQMFPFMDLSGFIYFLPFIKIAPTLYQWLAVLSILILCLLPYGLIKISKKTNLYHLLLIVIVISIAGYFTQHLQYHKRGNQFEMFGSNNFYYINSQINLYRYNMSHEFIQEMSIEPKLTKYEGDSASIELKKSTKILFIINESWGKFKNQKLHNQIIGGLLNKQESFEYFKQGHFPFQEATVNGELRELCQLQVKGFALNRLGGDKLQSCLPNYFKQQGFKTIAMHGASGRLYERYDWYSKAGFEQTIFAENLIGKKTCQAFRGVCDSQLFDVVHESFAQDNKVFFYWLTLTSHYPYSTKDLEQESGMICQEYGIEDNHKWCGNAKLQQQFFDKLSNLISHPNMRGVEVIVVGDHIPPSDTFIEPEKYLQDKSVAWVHFKIK